MNPTLLYLFSHYGRIHFTLYIMQRLLWPPVHCTGFTTLVDSGVHPFAWYGNQTLDLDMKTVWRQRYRETTCQSTISEPVKKASLLEAEMNCGSKTGKCIRAEELAVPGQTEGLLSPASHLQRCPAANEEFNNDQGKHLGILPQNSLLHNL